MTLTTAARACAFPFVIVLLSALAPGQASSENHPPSPPASARPQAESPKPSVPAAAIIEPEELARILGSKSSEKPLVFQTGFRFLFKEAHIPGAEYLGPSSKEEGLKQLRERVAKLPRGRFIVLYCGCCPWIRCPNVKPAYDALHDMGFTQVKVLRLKENFGTDWAAKGYPVAHGE